MINLVNEIVAKVLTELREMNANLREISERVRDIQTWVRDDV